MHKFGGGSDGRCMYSIVEQCQSQERKSWRPRSYSQNIGKAANQLQDIAMQDVAEVSEALAEEQAQAGTHMRQRWLKRNLCCAQSMDMDDTHTLLAQWGFRPSLPHERVPIPEIRKRDKHVSV